MKILGRLLRTNHPDNPDSPDNPDAEHVNPMVERVAALHPPLRLARPHSATWAISRSPYLHRVTPAQRPGLPIHTFALSSSMPTRLRRQ